MSNARAKLVANVNDQGQVEVAAVPTTLVGALGSLISGITVPSGTNKFLS